MHGTREAPGISMGAVAVGVTLAGAMLLITEISGRVFPKIRPLNWLVGAPLIGLGFVGGTFTTYIAQRLAWAITRPSAPYHRTRSRSLPPAVGTVAVTGVLGRGGPGAPTYPRVDPLFYDYSLSVSTSSGEPATLSPRLQAYVSANWTSLGFPYTMFGADDALGHLQQGVPSSYQNYFVDAAERFAKDAIRSGEPVDLIEELLRTGIQTSPSFRDRKLPGILLTARANSRDDVVAAINRL